MTHAETVTWLYAVVESAAAPGLARAPRGVPRAGRPRALAVAPGLWLVAASAPRDGYAREAIERGLKDIAWISRLALAHERVLAYLLEESEGVLPVKLFTLFANDQRALAHLGRSPKKLARTLARVRGAAQWSVRVRTEPVLPAAASATARARKATAGGTSPGTRFLERKQALHEAAAAASEQASMRADQLLEELSAVAREARRLTVPEGASRPGGARIVLDAAFLVGHQQEAAFERTIASLRRRLARHGLAILLSGPWPPYNFVG